MRQQFVNGFLAMGPTVIKSITFRHCTANNYVAGQSYTPVYTQYTARGSIGAIGQREVGQGKVLAGDSRVIIPVSELTVVPTTNDRLIVDGTEYAIIEPKQDPLGAFWNILVRL